MQLLKQKQTIPEQQQTAVLKPAIYETEIFSSTFVYTASGHAVCRKVCDRNKSFLNSPLTMDDEQETYKLWRIRKTIMQVWNKWPRWRSWPSLILLVDYVYNLWWYCGLDWAVYCIVLTLVTAFFINKTHARLSAADVRKNCRGHIYLQTNAHFVMNIKLQSRDWPWVEACLWRPI